ncbi:hypothetical protein PaecuDRAFT_2484 [Paenibacillus curdlanolyticus YK9]|uniref:Uncharacterized protein n=1 Tax=Paenibacillus curdlanolyticus YK9 TaxID=717606 RepID=E0I9Z7_9BACL|nr:hypothetical protein PaecuDRAFT_2484 [Paenibacillus curdlanolyticus YK9]
MPPFGVTGQGEFFCVIKNDFDCEEQLFLEGISLYISKCSTLVIRD